jgi:hypothetical protein
MACRREQLDIFLIIHNVQLLKTHALRAANRSQTKGGPLCQPAQERDSVYMSRHAARQKGRWPLARRPTLHFYIFEMR